MDVFRLFWLSHFIAGIVQSIFIQPFITNRLTDHFFFFFWEVEIYFSSFRFVVWCGCWCCCCCPLWYLRIVTLLLMFHLVLRIDCDWSLIELFSIRITSSSSSLLMAVDVDRIRTDRNQSIAVEMSINNETSKERERDS